ncbi:MAG TPA: hypothetical protein DDZ80_07620 [Cyanobacteria bacterium UBA8803]|nr:hypothetical protein [Cyanobacteria bacterium UBA9273]HBL58378.1 hypothetical protein [Cyanobacteria bacterium UBA8803]
MSLQLGDADDESVLDREVLESLRQIAGDKAESFLREIIDRYLLEDAPQRLQDIRDAVAVGDAGRLRQSAHALRSSSATLGAVTLANLCKDLEMMGCAGIITDAAPLIAQVEAEYEKVKVIL